MVSVIHLRQLEAAKKLVKHKCWSEEDEKVRPDEEEVPEITEEESLNMDKFYDVSDKLQAPFC